MSEKSAGGTRKPGRRVRRTRVVLGDALIEHILEKPFDAITVQEVLDRAGVSRSTFYTHYSDKNDLFVSDVDEGLQGMAMWLVKRNEASDRVAPVREFFGHVGQNQHLYAALVTSRKLQDFLDLALGHFARGIDLRLATLPRAHSIPAAERPALASALAGSLLALLVWWMRHGTPGSAEEMDTLFHHLVWTGVDSLPSR